MNNLKSLYKHFSTKRIINKFEGASKVTVNVGNVLTGVEKDHPFGEVNKN
jgi:hypothetical protein